MDTTTDWRSLDLTTQAGLLELRKELARRHLGVTSIGEVYEMGRYRLLGYAPGEYQAREIPDYTFFDHAALEVADALVKQANRGKPILQWRFNLQLGNVEPYAEFRRESGQRDNTFPKIIWASGATRALAICRACLAFDDEHLQKARLS